MSRDFDFWVGDWEVTNQATGELAGYNLIEIEIGGRVLVERYSTPGGFAGMSLNAYDAGSDRWHQCWMDSEGTVLDLYGGLVGRTHGSHGHVGARRSASARTDHLDAQRRRDRATALGAIGGPGS